MKNKLAGLFGKAALPALVAGAVLAIGPVSAMAAERGGGHEGHYSGGGVSGRSYGGEHRGFSGGREFHAGRDFDHHDYDRGYRGGAYFGFSAPYSYGYAAPNPCGYYDAYGYWHADPACYSGPAY